MPHSLTAVFFFTLNLLFFSSMFLTLPFFLSFAYCGLALYTPFRSSLNIVVVVCFNSLTVLGFNYTSSTFFVFVLFLCYSLICPPNSKICTLSLLRLNVVCLFFEDFSFVLFLFHSIIISLYLSVFVFACCLFSSPSSSSSPLLVAFKALLMGLILRVAWRDVTAVTLVTVFWESPWLSASHPPWLGWTLTLFWESHHSHVTLIFVTLKSHVTALESQPI